MATRRSGTTTESSEATKVQAGENTRPLIVPPRPTPIPPPDSTYGLIQSIHLTFAPSDPSSGCHVRQVPDDGPQNRLIDRFLEAANGLIRAAPEVGRWGGAVCVSLVFPRLVPVEDADRLLSLFGSPATLAALARTAAHNPGSEESVGVSFGAIESVSFRLGVSLGPRDLCDRNDGIILPFVPKPTPGRNPDDVPPLRLPPVDPFTDRSGVALAAITSAIDTLDPRADFASVRASLLQVAQTFRSDVLAAVLEPAFNEKLRTFDRATRAEKQAVCKWANSTLSELGLAVVLPGGTHPATMMGGTGTFPDIGRFEFWARLDDGTVKKALLNDLPEYLHLTAARPHRKPGRKAADRLDRSPKKSDKKPK